MKSSFLRAEIFPIIKGLLLAGAGLLILLAGGAAIAFWAELPTKYYHTIGAICLVLAMFAGGFTAARSGFDKGWLKGLLVGSAAAVIMLLISMSNSPSLSSILSGCAYYIIASTIGGICGIK